MEYTIKISPSYQEGLFGKIVRKIQTIGSGEIKIAGKSYRLKEIQVGKISKNTKDLVRKLAIKNVEKGIENTTVSAV